MGKATAILERSATGVGETGELADRSELALKPRSSPGSARSTIDLLLVYSPIIQSP